MLYKLFISVKDRSNADYFFKDSLAHSDLPLLQSYLLTAKLGRSVHNEPVCESTMTTAKQYAASHTDSDVHGHIFISEQQTKGVHAWFTVMYNETLFRLQNRYY